MLAHFSCLINIFFLSLSTLILSYFFFYWFAGCNYASACIWQQHEAAQRQLDEGKVYALFDFTVRWLNGRSTPCLISQYAQESMSTWPVEMT